MSTFIHSLRGQMSTPLYELGGKCPHMQFLGRGQMSEWANVRLPNLPRVLILLNAGHQNKLATTNFTN